MDPLANTSVPSIAHMFHENIAKFANKTLYMTKRDGQYRGQTYSEVGAIICNMAMGLASLGVKKNDKVAIIAGTRQEWAMSDFSILSLGAVTVPIYPTLPVPQVEYILKNSDSKIAFVADAEQLEKVIQVKSKCPQLTHVVLFSKDPKKNDWVLHFDELQALGKKFTEGKTDYLKQASNAVQANDVATIIYTSGTTGTPKGVMLTHKNLLSNSMVCSTVFPVMHDDVFLSFLPLSHIFERNPGHYLPFFNGSSVAYAESIETVAANMGEVRPTLMTAVPRLYEKMYDRVRDNLASAPPIRRKIFAWAQRVGKKARETGSKGFSYKIADKLVYSKLRGRLGGRIKIMVSGGAPLSKEIAEFFADMGVTILEGYGLTETSPVITVNRPALIKFGSVGCAIEGVEVKIAEDGEILTRGPHVMLGYYKNEAATKEVLDADGWFHTGDIGFLDSDDYLTITDRKKNIIVTSGGKNVAPQPIENILVTIPYIEQVMVIGDKRNFISALIVPNFERLRNYAKSNQLKFNSEEELLKHPEIYKMLDQVIQEAQDRAGFARYEKVKKFALLPRAFTIESGELTPSLKVKRNVVIDNFENIIHELYSKNLEDARDAF
ncbi:long-chain fatty acid--CoA ligase [bacterium]|nr:long-chain fatty acid--CoA ligase [bacterium]